MFAWIAENTAAFIICLVLAFIVIGALAVVLRDKKKGKTSCGGNCSACGMCGSCHKH
ncbi:MAG: FeoB-associated Cys-rich membrane protein [Clostridia bacterium]|nr:FeoB-associated Cys-rich membrane protein [Clostridia bacterium]